MLVKYLNSKHKYNSYKQNKTCKILFPFILFKNMRKYFDNTFLLPFFKIITVIIIIFIKDQLVMLNLSSITNSSRTLIIIRNYLYHLIFLSHTILAYLLTQTILQFLIILLLDSTQNLLFSMNIYHKSKR